LSGLSPFVDELDEHGAMAWVVGALGGESAFVGVAVIELSEEHGVIPGGAEGGPTLPSAITLGSVSRNAAVQFSPAALNFGHFGRLLREVCLQTWAVVGWRRSLGAPSCPRAEAPLPVASPERACLSSRVVRLPQMGWGIGLSCLEYVLTACDDGRPTGQLVEDHGSAAMTFPGAKVPRLAAILTAGVLALACLAGSAKADTLPRFYIGKWCPEFERSETFERAEQPSCGDKELTITSRGLVDAVYRCRFTRIRLGKAWPPATKTPMREWVREAHITARCATPPDSGVEGTLVIKLQIYKGGILDMWREPAI
jgi:hypothetical protein